MVAGVPMMNGASLLEGYVPDVDATVVTRVLQAGAEIVGKTHCEYFCLSGGSHTGAHGPVHNLHRHGYSAGGSSSGSAVVLVTGEADLALGADQGGSIRMPAGWCGIYGMKVTHGLVPYTGVMPIEATIRDGRGPWKDSNWCPWPPPGAAGPSAGSSGSWSSWSRFANTKDSCSDDSRGNSPRT